MFAKYLFQETLGTNGKECLWASVALDKRGVLQTFRKCMPPDATFGIST